MKIIKSWYEDAFFVVCPIGNIADVEIDAENNRTTWVKGRRGWYVDEARMEVLRKVELEAAPNLFDIPLPSEGYRYELLKQQN